MPVPRPLIAEKTPVGSVINERLLDINNYVYDLLKKASFTPQECKSLMRKPEHIRQNTEEGINQYANRILGLGVLVSLRLLRPSLTAVANALQINGLFGGYELSVPVGAVTAVLNATDPTTAAALLYYLVMDYRKVDTRLTLKQFQTLISAENLAVYLDLQQVEYDSERFIRHILNHTDTPSRVEALITLLEKNNKDPLAARVDLDKLYDQLVLQDQREHERPYDFSGMGPGPSSLGTSH